MKRHITLILLLLSAVLLIVVLATNGTPQTKRRTAPPPKPIGPPDTWPFPEPTPTPVPEKVYSFDEALDHRHGNLLTIRGQWKDRTVVESKWATAYMLGNVFTIQVEEEKGRRRFYRIWSLDEQPMISELLSRYPSFVEVEYDPVCTYAVHVRNVTPPPIISLPPPGDKPPRPKPQPTPKPKWSPKKN